ncbi:MAG: hypothetical protein EPN92_13605 [Chitinophagaceae bacterium]|nr:MAG: hypothetical protein EPN92_13605 [Chitinophagaceae bacterium]
MKKILLLSFVYLFSLPVMCQQKNLPGIEDLKKDLPSVKGIKRIDKLNEISYNYSITGQPKFEQRSDSLKKYASLAFEESKKIGYKKGMTEACIYLSAAEALKATGLRMNQKNDSLSVEKGIDYALQAVELAKELRNDELLGSAHSALGSLMWRWNNRKGQAYLSDSANKVDVVALFRKAGNEKKEGEACTYAAEGSLGSGHYEEAFEYCLRGFQLNQKVLPLCKTQEEQAYRVYLIQQSSSDMASLYKEAGDYQTSLEYLNVGEKFGREYETGWLMEGEKADNFRLLGQYDSAFVYIKKRKKNSPENLWFNGYMGTTFLAANNIDSALFYLQKSLAGLRKINQYDIFIIGTLQDIASAYAGKNDFNTAMEYSREAMTKAVNTMSRPAIARGYELLSKIHYALGNPDSAYLYHVKYVTLKDSIQTKQLLFRLSAAKKEAQIGFLNRDNKIKEQQLKQEATFRNFLIAVFIAVVFAGLYFFINLNLKRKNERLKQEQKEQEWKLKELESENKHVELQKQSAELEMQALRAQMNPHFIFNSLSSINHFILKNESKTASNYLTRFSRLIRMVLINSQKPLITLQDELEMLRIYLDMERLRFKNSFDYVISFINEIDVENVFVPPLILQPFCENALWHGLMHKEGHGHLTIDLSMENNVLQCVIVDDGIGREKAAEMKSKTAEREKSLGLQITTQRLALLNQNKNVQTFYIIEDILDENKNVAGTRVILKISHKELKEELI